MKAYAIILGLTLVTSVCGGYYSTHHDGDGGESDEGGDSYDHHESDSHHDEGSYENHDGDSLDIGYSQHDYHHYPAYKFEYGVNDPTTGDHKSQWEHRDGDVVHGEYTLDEADGTKRVVKYTADKDSGFNAVVERVGHAYHPEVQHHGYENHY